MGKFVYLKRDGCSSTGTLHVAGMSNFPTLEVTLLSEAIAQTATAGQVLTGHIRDVLVLVAE